ncbi:MAG: flavin reductase [Desulfovibrio sp.]|jgi:flavin reductase (DIM6/NTAB) family NADH-FMN oxidoreductase RutF/rubredoxin|nr:flavin reductase [Desulfovibrio sp.]
MDFTALFNLSYGLYILGVKTEKGRGGCVVDALAQVTSDEPPLLMLAGMKKNNTTARIKAEGEFTVSVLAQTTDPFVVANFGFQSSRDTDKWANVPHTVKDGLPVLDGACAYVRCKVRETKELSTHTVFFSSVTDAWNAPVKAAPLTFGEYQRSMKTAAYEAFKRFKAQGKIPQSAPKWRCTVCGHVYDGPVPFESLPADWKCPLCGVGRDKFEKF